MGSIHQLPVELIDGLCQCIGPNDLASLARTNTVLSRVAQRQLYRHISASSAARNLNVVLTLAQRPDLALYVRVFALRVASFSHLDHPFYCALADALSHMSELISLHLTLDPSASWVLGARSKSQAHDYPHLLRFTCSFYLDSYVAAFLATTPALTELEVDAIPHPNPHPIPSLPPSAIPNLTSFSGSVRAARVIAPGRPLQSVYLHIGILTEEELLCLADATTPIVILEATSYLPIVLLGLLAQYLPSLAYCRLATTPSFGEAPDVGFYREIATCLTRFPGWREFELLGMHWAVQTKGERLLSAPLTV